MLLDLVGGRVSATEGVPVGVCPQMNVPPHLTLGVVETLFLGVPATDNGTVAVEKVSQHVCPPRRAVNGRSEWGAR